MVYLASPLAVGPIVIFSTIVGALVLIILSVPTAGQPPDIAAHPALPVPSSALYISAASVSLLNLIVPTLTPVGLCAVVPAGTLITLLVFKKLRVVIIASVAVEI